MQVDAQVEEVRSKLGCRKRSLSDAEIQPHTADCSTQTDIVVPEPTEVNTVILKSHVDLH